MHASAIILYRGFWVQGRTVNSARKRNPLWKDIFILFHLWSVATCVQVQSRGRTFSFQNAMQVFQSHKNLLCSWTGLGSQSTLTLNLAGALKTDRASGVNSILIYGYRDIRLCATHWHTRVLHNGHVMRAADKLADITHTAVLITATHAWHMLAWSWCQRQIPRVG